MRIAPFALVAPLLALSACAPGDDTLLAESTAALTATTTTFALPTAYSFPHSLTVGPDGALWFLETGKVGRITTAGALSEFAAPVAQLGGGLATGPDRNLWFTNPDAGTVCRMTTAGAVTCFMLPANRPRHIDDHPVGIVAGPDGALWCTVQIIPKSVLRATGARIDRVSTAGVFTEYTLPTGGTRTTSPIPVGITVGPDGALWFGDRNLHRVERITTAGAVTAFDVPSGAGPTGIAVGPDRNLWFTTTSTSPAALGRVSTAGVFAAFPVPSGPNGNTLGSFLVAASDGALWTSDYDMTSSSGALVRSSTAGAITTADFGLYREIDGAAAGPDGALWFALSNNQSGAAAIGRRSLP